MAKQPKVYDSYWDRYRAKHPPKGPPMQHFRYIDVIRRPDGTLRPWEEHNILAKYEQYADRQSAEYPFDGPGYVAKAMEIKNREAKLKWK